MAITLNDLLATPKEENKGGFTPTLPSPAPVTPTTTPVKTTNITLEDLRAAPSTTPTMGQVGSLTVQDVINDPNRMSAVRNMMSKTKDTYYETAPDEEVMEDFMAHMRYMNTNELSTTKELIDITAADEETKAIYGDAYRVYNEMGSMFSNGDAWNGTLDYAGAVLSSPSTWLGLGIGKLAGGLASKGAAKAVTTQAINAATKQVITKSGGKVAEAVVKNELKNYASKAAARYHVAGALAVEMPLSTMQDYMYQRTQIEADVQDEYNFMQGAIATAAGGISAIPAINVLRTSTLSSFANAGEILDESFKRRAKNAAKRAIPQVKKALERKQSEWAKLVEAGKGMERNTALEDAISDWMFNYKDENSLLRILHANGADLKADATSLTDNMIRYAMGMGDEAIEEFNKALAPLGITFGQATIMAASASSRAGEVFRPISGAARFLNDFKRTSVGKKNANKVLGDNLEEATDDVNLGERQVFGYIQSLWKKTLVSTFATTAVNVKGWALARSSTAMADLVAAGGLMGRAGMKALINPTSALKDVAKARALIQNQTFALQTLIDPFLSHEAFIALLERAPKKVKRSISGQIFGGVDDFSPERFGLSSKGASVRATEKTTDFFQKVSLVTLQDSLTKSISGLTALDKQARINFGKGLKQLIEEGEAWRITDDMWEDATKAILRDTFSEDLSKGTHALKGIAGAIQNFSNQPGFGFILPFGKFLNNTVAFTYRHSPLAFISVAGRVFGKGAKDDVGDLAARATVGTALLGYFTAEQMKAQEEGLQWFQRRNTDGSIEDITNLFPYSVYALAGRIIGNYQRGEGMDPALMDSLLQQVGPLDAVGNLAAPAMIRDFTMFMSDPTVPEEEKSTFIGLAKNAAIYMGAEAAALAAGFTRPLDVINRTVSTFNPEAGGGLTIDRKQAEGFDKITLNFTRYTSSFFNYFFGEDVGDGVRTYGAPKESATSEGPVKMPNVSGYLTGTTYVAPIKNLNRVLGMVDKPPFRADSFTSGIPEYDAFINEVITPMLELRATELLKNDVFKNAPQTAKMKMVDNMIDESRQSILRLLDGRRIGEEEDRLNNARRKLMVQDRAARLRAKVALGITTPDHKLSLYEVEAIKRRMDLEEEELSR